MPLPRGEHITAAPVLSAKVRISSAAPRAPKPTQMANGPSVSNSTHFEIVSSLEVVSE